MKKTAGEIIKRPETLGGARFYTDWGKAWIWALPNGKIIGVLDGRDVVGKFLAEAMRADARMSRR
jgi:hypothetical protein